MEYLSLIFAIVIAITLLKTIKIVPQKQVIILEKNDNK